MPKNSQVEIRKSSSAKTQTRLSRRPGQMSQQDTVQLLMDIQQKVNGSPALNGAFDTLLYKVDKIEESQGKIVQTVASIHEAIYNPDNGLFSRISSVKATQAEDRAEAEKRMIELNAWKNQTDKAVSEDAVGDSKLQEKVESQQKIIDGLERWKSNVSAVGKWTLATVAGGIVTILVKVVYESLVH